jgi:hypothetical protein
VGFDRLDQEVFVERAELCDLYRKTSLVAHLRSFVQPLAVLLLKFDSPLLGTRLSIPPDEVDPSDQTESGRV